MVKIDRRKGGDRRRSDRHRVSIEVEWENAQERRNGTLSDLSMSGCFLLSGGDVNDGEAVTIHFTTTSKKKVSISGEIVNHVFEVGFAIRFQHLEDSQIVFLHRLIESVTRD